MQNIPTKTFQISSSSCPSCPSSPQHCPYFLKIYGELKAEGCHVPGYAQHEAQETSLVRPLVVARRLRRSSKDLSREVDLVHQAALRTAHSAVDPFFPVRDGKATHLVGVEGAWVVVEA